jgi:hypothetical protein
MADVMEIAPNEGQLNMRLAKGLAKIGRSRAQG